MRESNKNGLIMFILEFECQRIKNKQRLEMCREEERGIGEEGEQRDRKCNESTGRETQGKSRAETKLENSDYMSVLLYFSLIP